MNVRKKAAAEVRFRNRCGGVTGSAHHRGEVSYHMNRPSPAPPSRSGTRIRPDDHGYRVSPYASATRTAVTDASSSPFPTCRNETCSTSATAAMGRFIYVEDPAPGGGDLGDGAAVL